MEVDDPDAFGASEMFGKDALQRASCSTRLSAAKKQTVRVVVLPGGHGFHECGEAPPLDERLESHLRLPARLVCPVIRAKCCCQFVVVGAPRTLLREVHPVAIQVDVLVRHAPQPRESVRIDGMHEHCRHVSGQTTRLAAFQPVDLRSRSAEPFDPMRARYRDEYFPGIPRSDPRHVGRERFASRSAYWIVVALDFGFRAAGGGQETFARSGEIRAEWAVWHGGAAAPCNGPSPRGENRYRRAVFLCEKRDGFNGEGSGRTTTSAPLRPRHRILRRDPA